MILKLGVLFFSGKDGKMSWQEAMQSCINIGMTLLSLEQERLFKALQYKAIAEIQRNSKYSANQIYYIDLKRFPKVKLCYVCYVSYWPVSLFSLNNNLSITNYIVMHE